MSGNYLVKTESASKKYCRFLRRSLWYGLQDIGGELMFSRGARSKLRRDEFWAVEDVSFTVAPGECVALIGPNGAGKSTLLKMLNGLIKPDRGSIRIRGRVGALIELGAGFNPVLSGRENIYINGSVLGLKKREIDRCFDAIVEFSGVSDFIDTPVQNYSSGMRVRLGFAVAAHLDPDVLLIDEVLAVGDVSFRMKCFNHLLKLKEKGTSIIVVSHALNHLSRITSRALVMDQGKAVFDGDLSRAIGEYEKRVAKMNPASDGGQPSGSGIKTVRLKNHKDQEVQEFRTGDDIRVEITCETSKKVEAARIVVAIESPVLGVLGSFSTPYQKFAFDIESPETTIRLHLGEIPLLVGMYYLNVSLYGPDITDFLDRRAPAAGFQITGPETNAFGYGLSDTFAFPHHWQKVDVTIDESGAAATERSRGKQ